MLSKNLNEFELDWAFAPVRSGLIQEKNLKNKKVLLIGEDTKLLRAVGWSFLAWNEKRHLNLTVVHSVYQDGKLMATGLFDESSENGTQRESVSDGKTAVLPEQVDYVIFPGLCCREIRESAVETSVLLRRFSAQLEAAAALSCKRILLLSDGRVYGTLEAEFAASEYEAGRTDPSSDQYREQYVLQMMERILTSCARTHTFAYNIVRTGMIYGPCIPMLNHTAAVLAQRVAASEPGDVRLQPDRTSYICIHDVLTAVQFVLTGCRGNKIFNASGPDSGASAGEIAMMLYRNFPAQYRLNLLAAQTETQTAQMKQTAEIQPSSFCGPLLNTQLLCHCGFVPAIPLEDGLIILVKSLQNTGEVFIFDNTYLGKLDKVQKILLGYLLEIDRICKKHKIKYFLAGGTLLGAIRHHGFIPWDDDADVMMLREDYDHFLEVVQQELPDHIFLQLPTTEKGNYNPFTKLRINDTMFSTEFTGRFMDMHNGIFFDVLSHDKTGNHRWSQKLHLMATMLLRSIVFNKWGNTDIASGGGHPIICKIVDKAKYLVPMPFAVWAQNKALTFFQNRKSDYLYDGMGRNLKRGAFPAKWLEEAVYVDFEGYQFPVPKEYDKYLTYLYGDYMQMIPVSQRRTSHSIVLTDLGAYGAFALEERQKGRSECSQ